MFYEYSSSVSNPAGKLCYGNKLNTKTVLKFFIHHCDNKSCLCGQMIKKLVWRVEDALLNMCVKFQKNIPNRMAKIGLIVLFLPLLAIICYDKIPKQCTTVLRRDMHDSWVFPLLIDTELKNME